VRRRRCQVVHYDRAFGYLHYRVTGNRRSRGERTDTVHSRNPRSNDRQFGDLGGDHRNDYHNGNVYSACQGRNRHNYSHERCGPDEVGDGDGYRCGGWSAVRFDCDFRDRVACFGGVDNGRYGFI
jgi:hypothetical protein